LQNDRRLDDSLGPNLSFVKQSADGRFHPVALTFHDTQAMALPVYLMAAASNRAAHQTAFASKPKSTVEIRIGVFGTICDQAQ
jgi:hypothetical protein